MTTFLAVATLLLFSPVGAWPVSTPAQLKAMQAGEEAYRARRFEEAFKHFHKLATQGLPRAQTVLGMMYAYGEGLAQSPEKALRWYRSAARQGYSPAQYSLGIAHLEGTLSLTPNKREALVWLKRAAMSGHGIAKRQLRALDGYAYGAVLEDIRNKRVDKFPKQHRPTTLKELDLRLSEKLYTDEGQATKKARNRRQSKGTPNTESKIGARVRPLPNMKSQSARRTTVRPQPKKPVDIPGTFAAQLLASRSKSAAYATWDTYAARFPDLFHGRVGRVLRVEVGEQKTTFYRLQASRLPSYAAAMSFCHTLKKADEKAGCIVVRERP